MNLDPLKPGMIHFVKYGNGPGTIVVGIDGFRAKASRTGQCSGIKRGVVRDDKNACIGAWAEVYRKDWQHPARIEVSLAEYTTGRGPWQKMPETMIQKVAEAAALRMAFPDDLGGIYTKEEMDQAEGERARITPTPDDPIENYGEIDTQTYRIDFGQWRSRTLEDVYKNFGPEKIQSYIQFIENSAQKKGVEVSGAALEFIKRAEEFLGAMENGEFQTE
jgi:hypothetical protein